LTGVVTCAIPIVAMSDSKFLCCTRVYFVCDILLPDVPCHILVTIICMQLVYVIQVHSLRLALQCHAFI